MSRRTWFLIGAAALWLPCATHAQAPGAAPPRSSSAPAEPAGPAPPAPAFQAGGTVTDSRGVVVGTIQGVAEDARDEMVVVVKVDGKLVSVPESTLRLAGGNAVSSQTKAQILAAAGGGR